MENTTPISHKDIPDSFFIEIAKNKTTKLNHKSCALFDKLLEKRPKDALHNPPYIKMVSPMVRYSKLPFRILCRRYGADLAFTPMLISRDINRKNLLYNNKIATNEDAQYTNITIDEFSTCIEDRPLIAQFATNSPYELCKSICVFQNCIDGIDINCGCPQTWAIKDGIGSIQSRKPELVEELVKNAKSILPSSKTVSIKIRLCEDIRTTVELVRRAEKIGVDWITVHGRTRNEGTSCPLHTKAINLLSGSVQIPIIANGDIKTTDDMDKIIKITNSSGVLCARGALANPTIFSNTNTTIDLITMIKVAKEYLQLSIYFGELYGIQHHHIAYILYNVLNKKQRQQFNSLRSIAGIYNFLYLLENTIEQDDIVTTNNTIIYPSILGVTSIERYNLYHTLTSHYSPIYSPTCSSTYVYKRYHNNLYTISRSSPSLLSWVPKDILSTWYADTVVSCCQVGGYST